MTENLKKLEETQVIEFAHHRSMCLELHKVISKNHGDGVVNGAVHRCFLMILNADEKKSVHTTLALMKTAFEKAMNDIIMNSVFNEEAFLTKGTKDESVLPRGPPKDHTNKRNDRE